MSKVAKGASGSAEEVYFSLLPSTGKDRTFGFWDLLAVQICYGIAAWFFLVGSQTGMYLPAKEAIPTIIAGQCIPLLLVAGCGIVASRYGVEQLTSTVGIFGHKGTDVLLVFYMFSLYPSQAMVCLLFGQSATKFAGQMGAPKFLSSEYPGVIIFAVAALAIGMFLAWRGPNTLKWFTRISAVGMFVILIGLCIYVLQYYGFDAIVNKEPAAPIVIEGNPELSTRWSRVSALEMNIGMGLSWAYFFGQWTRLAKSESGAWHGTMWGWGLLASVAGVFAAFTALATAEYDPTIWLVKVSEDTGFLFLSIIGLFLMAVANVSSLATAAYPATITLKSRKPKLKWSAALAIAGIPVLILLQNDVYYYISRVYAFIGLLASIYGAIVVFDLIFVCKGRFSIRELFNQSEGYKYWKGYNPAALISIVAGFAIYLSILNPLTWESPTGLFPYTSAGLPTFFGVGIIYTILMKSWILKKYPVPFVNDIPNDFAKDMDLQESSRGIS